MWLAAAWPVANTSSPARLNPCIFSTTTTSVLGLPLSVSTTMVTLRMFEPCRAARPNEQGLGVLMSDTAHRLVHLGTLPQMRTSISQAWMMG